MAVVCVSLADYPRSSFAQACDAETFDGAFAGEVVVAQNWDCRERQEFWFTDQGSQIIPYVWFLHLEQASGTAKFSDPVNMNRYRYLPQKPTTLNPDGLAIGFTKGNAKANEAYGEISQDWLGMTCAACHTGQVEFNGAKYLIDGAPTMGDFEGLARDLVAAMKATLNDEAKFERFALGVIADSRARQNGGTGDRNQLRDQLKQIVAIRDTWNERNQGTSDYGHGRLDAIGAIFNETAATGLGKPGNVSPADAPVSYPFIWDTPQHDKVQWNGSVTNAGPGSLGRNVGEVLGVFGALSLNTNLLSRTGHASSINIGNLARLEGLMWQLQSPLWSDTGLPAIDPVLAESGREVFKEFCRRCHRDIDRSDPDRRIKARMFPVVNPKNPDDPNALATDITMAKNFLTKTAEARRLTGRFTRYWGVLSDFEVFERQERDKTLKAKILGYSVIGAITRSFFDNPKDTLKALKVGQPPDVVAVLDDAARHLSDKVDKASIRKFLKEMGREIKEPKLDPNKSVCFPDGILLCYKARPLNGIWATAPYLHNGSVRTMRQLLLPADQRNENNETTFKVGTREFDPVDMGFKNEGAFTLDTTLPGNSNAGHDGPLYGNDVLAKDEVRMDALLEYLKTL
jgi:cytochrome c5